VVGSSPGPAARRCGIQTTTLPALALKVFDLLLEFLVGEYWTLLSMDS
jgi:hypothetical protein